VSCLVADIGNTSVAVALCEGERVSHVFRVSSRAATRQAVVGAIRAARGRARPDGAVLCSVVPDRNRLWTACLRAEVGVAPIVVSHRLRLDVRVDYPRPATIGADRLANACGAVSRYGAPVIVADFGTALTFDVVTRDGVYVGGVIAPGLPLMSEYLYEKTALLPRVRLQGRCARVGRSTAAAMRIGAKVGHRGMVREIAEHVRGAPGMRDARLCATGGYAAWALEGLDMPFVLDTTLTLYGLGRIFDLNRAAVPREAVL
jgi:type III pantothenate kinase